ncbi:MAG: hypothetical protein QOF77_839 [Solirubrobacteraceae bacterium]|jgi:hypothetical protein|nr:hypothetical protein [Solirubrobacteraceae bacterium]
MKPRPGVVGREPGRGVVACAVLALTALAVLLFAASAGAAVSHATTTAVTCPSAVVGQPASCTVTVTATDGATPTGSVTVTHNSSGALSPTTCPLAAGASPGQATCSFTYTPAAYNTGQHSVYAKYGGDGVHTGSYGFVRFTVTGGRPTSTTVSCTPNTATTLHPGEASTCTATVTDTAPNALITPTGTVAFDRNALDAHFSASSCMLAPTGTLGVASCTVTYTPDAADTGSQKIYANYSGDTSHAVSHNSTVIAVNRPPAAGPVSFSGAVGNTVFGVGTSPAAPSTTSTGGVLSNTTDPEGDPVHAVSGVIPTAQGGSVAMNSDGSFTYTPPVGFTGADTFTFTAADNWASSTATATVNVANRVWYVKNNDAGGNDGRSTSPFHTLAQAQSASSSGDFIYVFKGDGTSTGQAAGITLKPNQHLIGDAQSLVVAGVTVFAVASPVNCVTSAANCPHISASSGNAITLANGVTVAGLVVSATGSANAITGTEVTGTIAITDTNVGADQTVDTGSDNGMTITNSAGGTLNLTLTGDTLAESSGSVGNDALNITTTGSSVVNPTISSTSFTAARGDLFQLNIGDTSSSTLSFMNNTLSNNNSNIVSGGGGVTITAGGGSAAAASLSFDIQHNTFRDALGNAVAIGNATGNNTVRGTFSNNTVGVAAVTNSGSAQGGDLSVAGVQGGSIAMTVENNNFYQYNNAFGVQFQTTSTFSLDVKFDNNTIASPSGGNRATGLVLNAGTTTGSTNAVCFDASSNSLAGSAFTPPPGTNPNHDVLYRQRNSTTVRLPGYTGSPTDISAVEAFVAGRNNPPPPDVLVTIPSTAPNGFTGGPACATP